MMELSVYMNAQIKFSSYEASDSQLLDQEGCAAQSLSLNPRLSLAEALQIVDVEPVVRSSEASLLGSVCLFESDPHMRPWGEIYCNFFRLQRINTRSMRSLDWQAL